MARHLRSQRDARDTRGKSPSVIRRNAETRRLARCSIRDVGSTSRDASPVMLRLPRNAENGSRGPVQRERQPPESCQRVSESRRLSESTERDVRRCRCSIRRSIENFGGEFGDLRSTPVCPTKKFVCRFIRPMPMDYAKMRPFLIRSVRRQKRGFSVNRMRRTERSFAAPDPARDVCSREREREREKERERGRERERGIPRRRKMRAWDSEPGLFFIRHVATASRRSVSRVATTRTTTRRVSGREAISPRKVRPISRSNPRRTERQARGSGLTRRRKFRQMRPRKARSLSQRCGRATSCRGASRRPRRRRRRQ